MKLSILMPVFNEIGTLEQIVDRVLAEDIDKELIIVDDGSTDGTVEVLKTKIAGKKDVSIHFHPRNLGKGAAIRTAQQHITGDVVIVQDADLEYDPRDYSTMLQPIAEGRADVVYGSRFMGEHRAFLFWHSVGNRFLTLITNLLYDTILTDMETCYKAFRADLFKSITIRSNRFEFEPEITAKIFKKKAKVFEVPIRYAGRDYDEGKKITWRDGFGAVWTLIKYRFMD